MDKSSADPESHIVESARVARELQALRQSMTPRQLQRADMILERLLQQHHTLRMLNQN